MASYDSILAGFSLNRRFLAIFVAIAAFCFCDGDCVSSREQGGASGSPYNSFTISSFSYATTKLKPYEWRYIRVDLPPMFSSLSVALESDVDPKSSKHVLSKLPMICLREGSPPVPDAYNISLAGLVLAPITNASFQDMEGFQNAERCYPMQKNISLKLTNEQIFSGVWYWGIFNGIGPARTQSKMINRGSVYSFSGNITVEGCATPNLWGQYCNQTVNMLNCAENYNSTEINQTAENVVFCRSSGSSCHLDDSPKIYSLDVVGISEQLTIRVTNLSFDGSSYSNGSGIILMCYARLGAIPLVTRHDYSANISTNPLVIHSPRAGRWYIAIYLAYSKNQTGKLEDTNRGLCYSLDWLVHECPKQKAGLNCTWERYTLQTVVRRRSPNLPFEAYYLPITGKLLSDSADFPLEPLLSNASGGGELQSAWTFFFLDIPYGAVGSNLHIRLKSETKINYEIYVKYGGLPSLDSWDYFYTSGTENSNGSVFLKLYVAKDDEINFYILYARGGTWSLGLRRSSNTSGVSSLSQTTMTISLDRCPQKCSWPHGSCQSAFDASESTMYSFCACDRDHGGFDCSIELVSHSGHIWQSIALIGSNVAALLPAYWSLRQKAYAEWVIFMSSGISSAIYHACDVGSGCLLNFHALQFLDFWLSFMAVVSTFVYLADISEGSKRTIHTVVAIVTALMAETGPTRSSNIVLVVAIGALGLLIGVLLELSTKFRTLSFSMELHLNMLARWQSIKVWFGDFIKSLVKRFRWGFILAGFTGLALAATSWNQESTETYWIWHSMWHISIYSSSFLFLRSKVNKVEEDQRPTDINYELTREDSFSRSG